MAGSKVFVTRDDILVFDSSKPQTDLPLSTLRRIIDNAAECAGRMRTGVMIMDAQGRRNQYEQRTALRLGDIVHDSLTQVVDLLDGKDLDDGS